jgi:hypothetical protein
LVLAQPVENAPVPVIVSGSKDLKTENALAPSDENNIRKDTVKFNVKKSANEEIYIRCA